MEVQGVGSIPGNTDSGHGIPPELAKTLFQPFATFGKSKGTGLGLYIALEIIHDRGGAISLDKDYKGGAASSFVLSRKLDPTHRFAASTVLV